MDSNAFMFCDAKGMFKDSSFLHVLSIIDSLYLLCCMKSLWERISRKEK